MSYFDRNLEPNSRYVYSVASVEADGTRSEPVSTEIIVGYVDEPEPSEAVPSPSNVSQAIYSKTATEFFWDRIDNPGVVYEIRLNGEPVNGGITDGISSYIDSLVPGADYTFTVVAVYPNSSTRSEPVEFNFTMPGGSDVDSEPPVDEPIAQIAADVTLENVLRIINTNAHDRVKFGLFAFDFSTDAPAPGLTLRDTSADITESRTFDCSGGGTLAGRFTDEPVQRTSTLIVFDNCALDDTVRNGSVIIGKGSDENPSINMVYSGYQETQVAANPVDNVFVEIPNGIFDKSDYDTNNFNREMMATPLLYTVDTRAGVEKVKDLQRNNTYYRDRDDSLAATELRVDFLVESFWTSGNLIDVSSPVYFSGHDSVSGFYETGKLAIVEKTTLANAGIEEATGNSIELDASTGDTSTYLFTVTEGDAVYSELRNWADLPETLPCPIAPSGAALQEECL